MTKQGSGSSFFLGALNSSQTSLQVGFEIFDIFEAGTDANKFVEDTQTLAVFGTVVVIADGHGMGDKGFRSPEAGSDFKDLHPFKKAGDSGEIGFEFHRDNSAKAFHKAFGKVVVAMGGEAGVVNFADLGLGFEPLSDFEGAGVMASHAEAEGFQTAQKKIGGHGIHNSAGGVAVVADL